MTKFSKKTIVALAGLAACAAASAGELTLDGVTFTSSFLGNVLTIEIDAAGRSGGWASAVSMDAISVKEIGSFTSASMTGPGGAWTFSGKELNAAGCAGGVSTGNACFKHSPVALGDDMIFTFTFAGGPLDLATPHLKVHFLDKSGAKVGGLLSETIPAVPEPETYALMLAGLAGVGFVARRRRAA